MNKVSGVYKITNTITGDFYIGSSNNVKLRWNNHRSSSTWTHYLNSKLYNDMFKYGRDNFIIDIIEETDNLKEREQYWIDQLKPIYNDRQSDGFDVERFRETHKRSSKAYYEIHHDEQLDKRKEYSNRLCLYKGETITLNTLNQRFIRQGIAHPTQEAKKYLIKGETI